MKLTPLAFPFSTFLVIAVHDNVCQSMDLKYLVVSNILTRDPHQDQYTNPFSNFFFFLVLVFGVLIWGGCLFVYLFKWSLHPMWGLKITTPRWRVRCSVNWSSQAPQDATTFKADWTTKLYWHRLDCSNFIPNYSG